MVLDLNLNHMKNMGIKFIVSGLILFTFQASYKLLKSY